MIGLMLQGLSAGDKRQGRNLYLELNDTRCLREYVKGSFIMAKTPPVSRKAPTWVNRNLTEEELAAFDADPPSILSLVDDQTVLIERGYRVTFGWDDKSACVIVCMFAPDDDELNGGMAISARSKDAVEAWGLCFYKHFVVLREHWGSAPAPNRVVRG